ncbi:hypothetical protein PVK06_049928 [Gossypium arboreum]|uniref:Uncharacterized protein n=1 Tax=Gossypium arboreum TaxID=29729 RepID=A0ABR0M9N5_GOSAR|nr:hypothetical protein PVK06_049928 [Gossypium arboreum]
MSYYPSWDNGNSNKGPRKKGRANGDPPATKMTRSTERTGMITALKAGIEENALNLLAHSTKTEKEVIGTRLRKSSWSQERFQLSFNHLVLSNSSFLVLRMPTRVLPHTYQEATRQLLPTLALWGRQLLTKERMPYYRTIGEMKQAREEFRQSD